MLDLGFRDDLEFILAAAPPERRTLMFSATVPRAIAELAQDLPARCGARHGDRGARAARRHRVSRDAGAARRARARHHQHAAAQRQLERAGVLPHPRGGAASDGAPRQSRLRGRVAVGRTGAVGTHQCAAGDARRARASVRRDRRCGARHRPAQPRSGDPRRPAEQSGHAAASVGPDGPRRTQGRLRADRAAASALRRRSACWASPISTATVPGRADASPISRRAIASRSSTAAVAALPPDADEKPFVEELLERLTPEQTRRGLPAPAARGAAGAGGDLADADAGDSRTRPARDKRFEDGAAAPTA